MRQPLRPVTERGIVRSDDAGRTWAVANAGLSAGQVSAMAAAADGGRFFAGTDPAAVFVSDDGAQSWREPGSLRTVPGYDQWRYPLPPPIHRM